MPIRLISTLFHCVPRGRAVAKALGAALLALGLATSARAADHLRLAVQKTGSTAWELAVVSAFGLDKQAGLDLEISELASTEGGKSPFRAAAPISSSPIGCGWRAIVDRAAGWCFIRPRPPSAR